jgi:DNA repair protein RadC
MAKQHSKVTGILDSENFGNEKRQFYFDIKMARNTRHYMRITRRDQQSDENYKRTEIILFEDDIPFFVEAITMLLGRLASENLGVSS